MSDLDILIQMADVYNVEIRELIDGERKGESVDKEIEKTVLKVADYGNAEKQRITRRLCCLFIAGVVTFVIYLVMNGMGIADTCKDGAVADCMLGFSFGIMLVGVFYTSGFLVKCGNIPFAQASLLSSSKAVAVIAIIGILAKSYYF